MSEHKPTNHQIAQLLEKIADRLEETEANPFRVRAYRDGAQTVAATEHSLADVVEKEGTQQLQSLPDIGEGLAAIIGEFVSIGHSTLLEQLQTDVSPVSTLTRVPGIGETLANRIVQDLHIKSLPELEQAAHDGRLAEVEGFGARRVQAVQKSLAGMLSQAANRRSRQRTATQAAKPTKEAPSVATLLDVDAEYRRRAQADDLQKIAPRRFNPDNEAWLPIMHIKRNGWSFTTLFSNTSRAHELDKTDDWVVIYYQPEDADQSAEEQNTVVTEQRGTLRGKRVVRGREAECRAYYNSNEASAA